MNTQQTNRYWFREANLALTRQLLPFVCVATFAAFAGMPRLAAQTPTSSEIIKMNPFEVVENQDDTFRAMSVGSGSRLRLDLKDTPVAYSVINRQFIDALGIVDLVEAAGWATGNTFYQTDNGGSAFGNPSQYFSRGNLTDQGDSFGAQRNFYQNVNQGGDSYAVESFDFGRGPNAALFGQGSDGGGLSGVSSMQTKRARFDNSKTSISAELGSFKYRRTSIDINRPLTDRIGLRINAVDFDRHFWRIWDTQTSRGLTIAATVRLTDTTELRIEGSTDRSQRQNVGGGWDEQLSAWDGKTVFRGPITNAMASGNAVVGANNLANASYGTLQVLGLGQANPSAPVPFSSSAGLTFSGETNGIKRFTGANYLYDPYNNTIMNYQNAGLSLRGDESTRTPIWSRNAPNGAYYVRGSSGAASYSVGRSFHVKKGMPDDMFSRAEENSKFRVPPWQWNASVDEPATSQRSKDLNLALTQSWKNFAFEFGADLNRNVNWTDSFNNPNGNSGIGGGRTMVIDLNMLRPDGTPNPGFLDGVNTFGFSHSNPTVTDRTLRMNMGYSTDLGKWGNYVFNVQASSAKRDSETQTVVMSMKLNADSRRWQNDTVSLVNWASDKVRAYTEPDGKGLVFTDVNWTNPENPVIMAPRQITPDWVLSSYGKSTTRTSYALAQTTAKYFNNKVILTMAYRRDHNIGSSLSSIAQGDRPVGWNGEKLFRPDAPADYFTMTYIEKNNTTGLPVSGKARLSGNRPRTTDAVTGLSIKSPLYLNERFRDDYNSPKRDNYGGNYSTGVVWHATKFISPYLNYSTTFTPQNSTTPDLTGEARDPVSAYGYDFGANFNFLNDRITAKYNFFKQVRQNDSFTPAPAGNINTLYQANAFNDPDTTTTGRNARGAQDLPGTDYQDRNNSGYEIEVSIERLVPGLRVTANGSYGWFAVENRGRLIREYVPDNSALFTQILQDAGGMLDTTQHQVAGGQPVNSSPGLAIANPAITPGIDTTSAINAYNNLWINYASLDTGRIVRTPTQPEMKFVVDYTLQRGRMKGLGVSAAFQWQGRVVYANYGNQSIINPNNPLVALDDPSRSNFDYAFMKGSYNTQLNMRYNYRLTNGNSLAFALRIDNPIDNRTPVVGDQGLGGGTGFGGTFRQPQGDLSKPDRVSLPDLVARYTEPISWRLTTTYSFGGGAGRNR